MFYGLSDVECNDKEKQLLRQLLDMEINASTADTFYMGYHGCFDQLCFETLKEMQKDNPHIKLICVYTGNNRNDFMISYAKYCFDDVIRPVINVSESSAALKRGKWLVDNSDMVVTFFTSNNSSPGKIYDYAKRKNKACVNIASRRREY